VFMIGTDSTKRTHTVVVLDDVGRKIAGQTVPATGEGHLCLAAWAGQWPQAMFALEDCRHLTRRLEQDLLAAGRRVASILVVAQPPVVPGELLVRLRRVATRPAQPVQPLSGRQVDQVVVGQVVVGQAV
jgi:hypothetical protein